MFIKPKRKNKRKPPLEIFFDTETYKTIENEQELVKAYLIGWYCDNQFNYSTGNHSSFFNFLKEKYKTHRLILWAYNANYDLTVLLPSHLKHFEGAKCDYKISDAKRFICFKYSCKDFKFVCKDAMVWNTHIKGLNTWLEIIGEKPKIQNFVYDKYDAYIDKNNQAVYFYDEDENEQKTCLKSELEYLSWDCEGLAKVVEFQTNQKSELCKMTIPNRKPVSTTTAPSMAVRLIDAYMCKTGWFNETFRPVIKLGDESHKIYAHMCHSNVGGYTAFNKKKLHWKNYPENIFSFDVNSMYPYVMYKGVPCGELLFKKPKKDHVTWYEITCSKCEWIEKYSHISQTPLPDKAKTSHLNFYILKEYYDFVNKYSTHDMKVLGTYYQIKNYDISRFIKNAYTIKLKALEEEKDPEKRATIIADIKLLLNSIYGQLCKKVYVNETTYNLETCNFDTKSLYVDEYRYTLAGAYVTQMSRLILMRVIVKEIDQGNEFIYSDTDSIKLVVNKPVLFKIHPEKLGFFKNEGWEETGKGYTHFYGNGMLKKNLIFNKNDLKSIKLTLSCVMKHITQDLRDSKDLNILTGLFSLDKRISIRLGGKGSRKNEFGQSVIVTRDISLCGDSKLTTHILEKINNKWVLNKK